jgi:hypothetical protein
MIAISLDRRRDQRVVHEVALLRRDAKIRVAMDQKDGSRDVAGQPHACARESHVVATRRRGR